MNPVRKAYWIAKGVGWDNLARRMLQAWRQKTGWLAKRLAPERFTNEVFVAETGMTAQAAREQLEYVGPRLFGDITPATVAVSDEAQTTYLATPCDRLLAGESLYFSRWYVPTGFPPEFNCNAQDEIDWPTGKHWRTFAKSGPPYGDLKLLWEPSRLSMLYLLARKFSRTNDARFAEAAWELIDAWVEQNPPQLTGNWACGQENAFRLMAMLFAASTCLSAATDARCLRVVRYAWQCTRHIDANINYARSQKNNHAISEALAMWTTGVLFPSFPNAAHLARRGMAILVKETRRQIYDDGSYVQHSMNYHRVMLDDLLWVISLARRQGVELPQSLLDRFQRATRWLAEVVDPISGRVPNYGSNDGANILPLSCSDYLDYRPTLQAAWFVATGKRFFDAGEWDEKLLWLFGLEALAASRETQWTRQRAVSLDGGGYYILRGETSWMMTRCHTYRDRPAAPDMLHVDLWHNGENMLRDGGSFSYCTTDPVGKFFKTTAANNTIEINGAEQMVKGPRFLWFNWVRSHLTQCVGDESSRRFIGEHYGYRRLDANAIHRREVVNSGDHWLVRDRIFAANHRQEFTARQCWRLHPGPWNREEIGEWILFTQGDYAIGLRPVPGSDVTLCEGESSPPMGWESLYYGEKTPCPTLIHSAKSPAGEPLDLDAVMGPREQIIEFTQGFLEANSH